MDIFFSLLDLFPGAHIDFSKFLEFICINYGIIDK